VDAERQTAVARRVSVSRICAGTRGAWCFRGIPATEDPHLHVASALMLASQFAPDLPPPEFCEPSTAGGRELSGSQPAPLLVLARSEQQGTNQT
jgi:hypothetical protein